MIPVGPFWDILMFCDNPPHLQGQDSMVLWFLFQPEIFCYPVISAPLEMDSVSFPGWVPRMSPGCPWDVPRPPLQAPFWQLQLIPGLGLPGNDGGWQFPSSPEEYKALI